MSTQTKKRTISKKRKKPLGLSSKNSDNESFALSAKDELSFNDDENMAPNDAGEGSSTHWAKSGKTVEDIYQRKTQLEHILTLPDTYIGSTESAEANMWVFDETSGLHERQITYVPGLYKIFDEILVNAADNHKRCDNMTTLKVDIDPEQNTISVYNDGDGIPVEMHSEENMYVPSLIFGELLTSSNYDQEEKRVTGGRNGYGAKLTNIYSTQFTVETADAYNGKMFKQVFSNNMRTKPDPIIKPNKKKANWTRITFSPDLPRFGMSVLDKDTVDLMSKRVYDMAGVCQGLKVYLNGDRIPVKGFKDYVYKYVAAMSEAASASSSSSEATSLPVLFYKPKDKTAAGRWEIAVSISEGQFQQISYVNSICTSRGGQHVNHVADQIAKQLLKVIKKSHKRTTLKPFQIKSHLTVFVNCLIENPSFDSQTKDTMTLKPSKFGSKCELSDKFLKEVEKCGVVENILNWLNYKDSKSLKKTDGVKTGRITGIPKLDDANNAGGRNSTKCTLIITEGDSAKALAVSGLAVVGRDNYGVFPLKGKLLNVRDAELSKIKENAEINSLKQILGLKHGKVYTDVSSLRYGSLMIMADQDHDGSHIKGLVINFIHKFWPSLLKIPGFLVEFVTPIVKTTKGKKKNVFFTVPEYDEWKEEHKDERGWKIKYYKGLGTSSSAEAKEYFSDLGTHQIDFEYSGPEDDEFIDLAFSKKRADNRKEWLRTYEPGTFVDHSQATLTYNDFVNKELILYSIASNERAIPSVMDGLKPGQRKVLFACFKRNLKSEIKVAQLAGYVSEHAAYHHGEQSLAETIIKMAQNYVGSNNINLLSPNGQFGTRLQGGKDAASPRYIFTKLESIARTVFHPLDDPILEYTNDDGFPTEPLYYVPIIPMILVNGTDGIGSGYSSNVPLYSPRDLIANIRRMMNDDLLESITPWYRGFKGTIVAKKKDQSYHVYGCIDQIDDTTVSITELPINDWTQKYKEWLESNLICNGAKKAFIKDFKENHTDTTVEFTVTMSEENMREALKTGLTKKFKLTGSLATSNMTLFDQNSRIAKYETAEDILKEFYHHRLQMYRKRKDFLVNKLEQEYRKLDNKARFVRMVINDELVVSKRVKEELLDEMSELGFELHFKAKEAEKRGEEGDNQEEEEEEDVSDYGRLKAGYDYLLTMSLWSLTAEKVEKLEAECEAKEQELNELLEKNEKQLWEADLQELEVELDNYEEALENAEKKAKGIKAKKGKGKGKAKSKAKKSSKAKKWSMDFDDDDDDDDFDEEFMSEDDEEWAPSQSKSSKSSKTTSTVASKKSTRGSKTTKAAKSAKRESIESTTSTASSSSSASSGPSKTTKSKSSKSKTTTATKKSTAVSKKKVASVMDSDSEEESDDDMLTTSAFIPLSQRLAMARSSKATQGTSKSSKSSKIGKISTPIEDLVSPSPPQSKQKKRRLASKPSNPSFDDDFINDDEEEQDDDIIDSFSESEDEYEPTPVKKPVKKTTSRKITTNRKITKKPAAKKAAAKKPAKKTTKKTKKLDDSFDFDEDDEEEDDGFVPSTPVAARKPSRRAAAKVQTYVDTDDEEDDQDDYYDDGEDSFVFDEEDDDDEFEFDEDSDFDI